MGMAASQARLLTLTARIHDVEYQAQNIQNAKIMLATQQDEVYQEYLNALDETTLTVKNFKGERVVANFDTLCGIDAVNAGKKERYLLRDDHNRIIVPDEIADGYRNFKSNIGGSAYDFALFMMNGQPADFDLKKYKDAEERIFKEKNDTDKLGSLKDNRDAIATKLVKLEGIMKEYIGDGDEGFCDYCKGANTDDWKKAIQGNLHDALNVIEALFNEHKYKDDNTEFKIPESATRQCQEIIDEVNKALEELEYNMFTQFGEEVYAADGNKDDFDHDDFWYYVNMFKQIEANGDSCVKISEFDGIDGIGNARTDSDWLQDMIKAGKITIDISTLDNKGNISFRSTGVPSDSSLEYTTTSTIDKAKLAKVEAEYEHKLKQIDQKDKKYDMDLSKLETERAALTKEYDSVKKVAQENIDRTFGIFS